MQQSCEYLTFLNYDAQIYAINRKGEDVKGCKGYQSLLEIPYDVDLAIILTPAPTVPDVIEDCGKKRHTVSYH